MGIPVRSAPSITRVHTLHRIRSVVTHVQELMQNRVREIDDITVANHLIETHLSKPTTKKFRDQIGRRARDHLETARYLGLLYRQPINGKFTHLTTNQGKALSGYDFDDECPKDSKEEAILIDKVCRMKLANTSYLQTPRDYEKFRSRICLNILSTLKIAGSALSLFQIAYVLAEPVLDPFTGNKKLEKLVDFVTSEKFKSGYMLSSEERKTIRRDTNPFLDWCAQLDLIRWSDSEHVKLTKRGKVVERSYSSMIPIWYKNLGQWSPIAAAVVLLINFLKLTQNTDAISSLLRMQTKWGLFDVKVVSALKMPLGESYRGITQKPTLADFTFQYDVPPEQFSEVKRIIGDLLTQLGYLDLNTDRMLTFLETYSTKSLRPGLKTEADQQAERLAERENIRIKVGAAAIYSQFRSGYEASSYALLKAIENEEFKVQKYQAQLEPFFVADARWRRFATNNPDLLITNHFFCLVECKSTAEWGDTFNLNKSVLNEITTYNLFCEAIKKIGLRRRCVVLFCYEGRFEFRNIGETEQLLHQNFPNVMILTRHALQKALINVSFKNELQQMIKSAEIRRHLIDADPR
jgi:hypothetical protein